VDCVSLSPVAVEELSFVTQRGYVDKPLNRVPSLLVVPRELKVVALAGHADGKVSDASPGVEPCAESMKGSVIREHGAPAKPTAARRSWPRWSSTFLDYLIRLSPGMLTKPRCSVAARSDSRSRG